MDLEGTHTDDSKPVGSFSLEVAGAPLKMLTCSPELCRGQVERIGNFEIPSELLGRTIAE